jgi:hypothetical protein
MASKSGRAASVKIGNTLIAGLGTWTMSGISRDTIEDTAFGDEVKKYQFGMLDGGTISFNGNYDPSDPTGQNLLDDACKNASMFANDDLKLYIDNTSYFRVDTGGNILITKSRAITMDKNGLGTISFEAKVSGKAMILV